uniref:C2H2-type domain-containing protein n=2 Tax=Arion vulgaris TaxID=1028688 RepID=A0A0B7AL32_9EUPU
MMPVFKAYCNVCNLWLNSDDQLVAHQTGKSHKRRKMFTGDNLTGSSQLTDQARTIALMIANQGNSSKVISHNNYQSGEGICTTQRDNNVGLNEANRNKFIKGDEYFCNICVVHLTSRSQADMHYMGSKHKKTMAVMAGKHDQIQDEGVKRMLESVCEICNVSLSSKAVADAHYAGSKHERKLRLSQSIRGSTGTVYNGEKFLSTIGTQSLQVITNSLSQSVQSSSISMVPVHPGSVGDHHKGLVVPYLYCSFCGVRVNSQQQMEAHWQGTKHKNTVNGTFSQPSSTFVAQPITNHNQHVNMNHFNSHGNYGSSNVHATHRTVWF